MSIHAGQVGPCRWALVVGSITEPDFERYVENLEALTREARAGEVVIDLLHSISVPTPVQRRRIASIIEGAVNADRVAGHAVVANSALGRGALTAINWFVKKRFPEEVFAKPEDALGWLSQRNPVVSPDRVLAGIRAAAPEFRHLRW